MELSQIVEDWLKSNGYDGLFNADVHCGCKLDDLMPCGEPTSDCQAGYLVNNPGCSEGCNWHIQKDNPRVLPDGIGNTVKDEPALSQFFGAKNGFPVPPELDGIHGLHMTALLRSGDS